MHKFAAIATQWLSILAFLVVASAGIMAVCFPPRQPASRAPREDPTGPANIKAARLAAEASPAAPATMRPAD